jgi:DNA-binding SARP family transcriptional activator
MRQPEQVRRFLLMTSQFEVFDVALCEKVLGPLTVGEQFDWTVLFEAVRMGNLFSVPLDHDGRWMRYHQLFQHFLRSQLQYEQSVLAWHIQENLAHAYEEQQSWDEALQVYAKLGDYANQVRVLSQTGAAFIASGRLLTLANWLEKLPDNVVYSHPALISLLGILHTTRGDNLRALELLGLAESQLRGSANEGEWMIALVRRAEVCRQIGRFDDALEDTEKILALIQDSDDPDMQYTFAEAQRVKGLCLVGLGHLRDAQSWLEKALYTCRHLGILKNIPILETELGVVHRRLGETKITEQYYASALKAWKAAGNTGWKARLLNNMGLLYHKTGRLEQAFIHLQDSLKTAESSGYTRIQANVLISLGDLLTDVLDFDSAYDYYDRALTLSTHLGHSRYIFYSSVGQARLHRLNGEPLLAVDELRHAEISQVSLGTYEKALSSIELGCCWLDAGKLESAIIAFRDSIALLGGEETSMERSVARLWLAVASYKHSSADSITEIKELLPRRREWQIPTQFMIAAGQAATWMEKNGQIRLSEDPVLNEFFARAAELRDALPGQIVRQDQVPVNPIPKTPRLEILSFGEVRVFHSGRIVNISDWQTREARDLFLFMLQSRPLTKEQIALEFWPDISPARLKMRFKINIYRIRRALGQDVILFENDRYGFNHNIDYSWDRKTADELLESLKVSRDADRITLLKRVTELLKYPFLENLDAQWSVSDRLRYQDLYLDLMVDLASMYLHEGRNQECLDIARMVLESDPLREAAHRMIIQAYASLHNPTGMVLQYRKYQETLMTELGIQPSNEMSTFFEQLLDTL